MMQAIFTDPQVAGRFTMREVPPPHPRPFEAIVQVKAISLNRGEVRDALNEDEVSRPGWDFAGVVLQEAEDGTGPNIGSRVVGLLPAGAWAEKIAAQTSWMAEIPDSVTFSQASTLPVAALSALYALRKGGLLLGKKVLITGSTGGVGLFAHQLATQAGAYVIGTARSEEKAPQIREVGANEVIVGDTSLGARRFGPYDLILDTVGGETLAGLLSHLKPEGICVTMGYSSSPHASIDVRDLIHTGRTMLYGMFLLEEMKQYDVPEDLRMLSAMVARGNLIPQIAVEASWTTIGSAAQQLMDRKYSGKAVLHINDK